VYKYTISPIGTDRSPGIPGIQQLESAARTNAYATAVTYGRRWCERDDTRTLTETCIGNWKEIGDESGRRTRLRFSAAAHDCACARYTIMGTLLYYYYYFHYLCQLARQMAMVIRNVPCVLCAYYAYTHSVECTTLQLSLVLGTIKLLRLNSTYFRPAMIEFLRRP